MSNRRNAFNRQEPSIEHLARQIITCVQDYCQAQPANMAPSLVTANVMIAMYSAVASATVQFHLDVDEEEIGDVIGELSCELNATALSFIQERKARGA